MTTPRLTTRRDILRLAGVAAAGTSAAACSRRGRGPENHSRTTSSDACGSVGLPYLFGSQSAGPAGRASVVGGRVERTRAQRTHERFMRFGDRVVQQ